MTIKRALEILRDHWGGEGGVIPAQVVVEIEAIPLAGSLLDKVCSVAGLNIDHLRPFDTARVRSIASRCLAANDIVQARLKQVGR